MNGSVRVRGVAAALASLSFGLSLGCATDDRPLAVRHTDEGRIVLNGRRLIEHAGGAVDERSIDTAEELLGAIRDQLGIPLEIENGSLEQLWAAASSVE